MDTFTELPCKGLRPTCRVDAEDLGEMDTDGHVSCKSHVPPATFES